MIELVILGKQAKACKMLTRNPLLIYKKAVVFDRARTLRISGWIYAAWALDTNLMFALLKTLQSNHQLNVALIQRLLEDLKKLEELGTWDEFEFIQKNQLRDYHSHFTFDFLIDAYASYLTKLSRMIKLEDESEQANSELKLKWKLVCQEQAKLPYHVIQEFHHPSRSFFPNNHLPLFNQTESEKLREPNFSHSFSETMLSDWIERKIRMDRFVLVRGGFTAAHNDTIACRRPQFEMAQIDQHALIALKNSRRTQFALIKEYLEKARHSSEFIPTLELPTF